MKLRFTYMLIAMAFFLSCQEKEAFDPFTVCKDYDQADIEMEALYEKIRLKYSDEPIFLARFQEAQVSWIQYRSRRLRALYPKDWDRHYRKKYGREIFNPCKCEENLRLVTLRNQELMVYLQDDLGNNDCPNINFESK